MDSRVLFEQTLGSCLHQSNGTTDLARACFIHPFHAALQRVLAIP